MLIDAKSVMLNVVKSVKLIDEEKVELSQRLTPLAELELVVLTQKHLLHELLTEVVKLDLDNVKVPLVAQTLTCLGLTVHLILVGLFRALGNVLDLEGDGAAGETIGQCLGSDVVALVNHASIVGVTTSAAESLAEVVEHGKRFVAAHSLDNLTLKLAESVDLLKLEVLLRVASVVDLDITLDVSIEHHVDAAIDDAESVHGFANDVSHSCMRLTLYYREVFK